MSLLVFLVLIFIVSLAGGQLQIIGYMPYAVLASALFGIALGLKERSSATAERDLESCLIYLLLLMALLCAFRFSLLGELAIFPDADTYFGSLLVLGHEPTHELIATTALIALLNLNLRCFMFAGRCLSAAIGETLPLDLYQTVLSAGLASVFVAALVISTGASPAVWAGLVLLLALTFLKPTRRQLILAVLAAGTAYALAIPRQIQVSPQSTVMPAPLWIQNHERAMVPLLEGDDRSCFAVFTDGEFDQVAFDPSMSNSDWHRLQQDFEMLDLRDAAPGFYQIPFQVWPRPEKVLILGAGTGNHVAACLAHGSWSVDAVEIDPYLLRLGLNHPARPYEDPRVKTHCQDPRTFLMSTAKTYDLIIVAEPEGQEAVSPFSPMRRSDFLYTVEALKLMRNCLSDKGVLVVASDKYERWFMLRLVKNMIQVFEMADGGVLTTAGQCVFTSKHHARDLHDTLTKANGLIISPDTIELNKDSLGAASILDESPFPFTGLRTIPLSYLWCMYVLIAIMLANLGSAQPETPVPSLAKASTRHYIRCGAWAVVLTLSLASTVTLVTRILGSSVEVIGLCLAGASLLGLAAGAIVRKRPRLEARHVTWATAVVLVLFVLGLRAPAQFAAPVAVLSLLPVFLAWMGISLLLAPGVASTHSRELIVRGVAVGLLTTNLSFMIGTSGLLLIALVVLLAGQLLPWELMKPNSAHERLVEAGAGN